MAEQLGLRNILGGITDQLTGEAYRTTRADRPDSSQDSYDDDDEDDDESDTNDAVLLVRSTISRDTTHDTPAVDMLDLSKFAAQTNELLLNARDNVPGGPPKQPQSLPPPGFSAPPPPAVLPKNLPIQPMLRASPGQWHPGTLPNALKPPIPMSPHTRNTALIAAPRSILAEIKPGFHWRAMFEQTWSDPTDFARYNWRETLRITGRRKSESDLFQYLGEEENGSWISQYLSPNASRTHLVDTWKRAGRAVKQTNSGAIPLNSTNNQPDFGAITGRAAEAHLGVDLYNNTRQSMFVGYLLDTIETLRMERDFLEDLLTKPRPIELPQIVVPKPSQPALLVPKLKILHRVFCKSQVHGHDGTVYEDLPTRIFSERTQDLELVGKKIIRNLTYYYSQDPEISVVVFKEHICVESFEARVPWRQQRRGQGRSEISPRAERLRVVSPLLQTALDHVALCSELESRSSPTGTCEMAAPYLFFYHHKELLNQYAEKTTGIVKQHVMVLLDFLRSDYGAEYHEADTEFSTGNLTQKHFEKLYRPNDIVMEKSEDHSTAYVVNDWPWIVEKQMRVPCWTWHYDGDCLQRHESVLKISLPLHEICTLDKLKLCPIKYANVDIIKELRDRGRKFWKMRDQYFGCFSGRDFSRKSETHHHLRVVVDMSTHSRMHPLKASAIYDAEISSFDEWPRKIPRDKTPDDSMIMLCPPTVFGFMLQEKTWLKLDVNGIHPIEWNKRAFDRLVLNIKTKELITALVEVRISTGRMEDVIGGKGNGLMILLHGGPGTGKTLTAESVAEIAEKPLYRVTCGDIGTKADDVEKYLSTVLYLAKIWNCVLLLDEADVFLEERTIADLERNSLVSVFLRILEYYDGILIMTSNRVGTFDEAFKSRIQVSLHYEDLSKKSRKTIWSNFIATLADGDEDVNINDLESHLDEVAQEEMNGRQIRNAMTTARQLALHRKERLEWEHLDQVLKTAREFNQYLKNVQGHTDKQWARAQRLR